MRIIVCGSGCFVLGEKLLFLLKLLNQLFPVIYERFVIDKAHVVLNRMDCNEHFFCDFFIRLSLQEFFEYDFFLF